MHSPMSAQVLMRKGKRGAAVFVQAECNRTSDPQHLKDLLDHLLNPLKSIDEPDIVDWITWLVAGGKSPAEFASLVRRYDNATTCGLVWTANFVAYRCRTCGISPCMSLCADCFQKGDHTGHDFNMFRSQAGGACDCGDMSVMKESGFCDRHGPRAQIGKPSLPPDLLGVANVVMPRVILRLVQHLRDYSSQDMLDRQPDPIEEADAFITMLHEYSGTGAAMRSVMTSALINPQVYAQLTEVPGGDSEYAQFMKSIQRRYEQALESLPGPECPEEYKDFPALKETLIHCTFLEELVFWTVKFEFSQKLVCLLLNLLPDPLYKEAFTRAFVLHYARISRLLVQSSDPDTLSNRVVHVSVQLFSNEELAFKMTEQLHLLHVMVISLKDMMSKILRPSTLQDPTKNFHFVVDCSKHVMKDHCYWPLVSDLSNLLSHRRVALHFMSDDGLLEMWFAFLSMFQGMNVNQRELTTHIEFEPSSYYAAFSAELEAPASAMWALALHLRDTSTISLTRKLLKHCLSALEDWFDAIGFSCSDQVDDYQVSFHIPLHRYLAAFTGQVVRAQGLQLKDVLPPSSLLQLIMMHPLRIQASFYEILCGLWVRNGLQIRGQAMSYIQCHFGNSMVDADMYLLQICAMNLAPSFVVNTVLERFHVMDLLSLNPRTKSTFLEPDHEAPMLESCLTFLASLMSLRTNIGLNETDLDCLEMVSLLCMADRTHSQLMELLPEKSGAPQNKDFDAVLAQVADYKAPNFEASGSMQQGMYVPKPGVWEDLYDPIYVLLRAVHRKDFQSSMDRFTQYVQLSGKFPRFSSGSSSSLWPPFRLPLPVHPSYEDPRVLMQSRTFHAVLFVLLYKAVHNPQVLSEQALALTIYLIDLAVSFARDRVKPCGNEICVKEPIITQPDDRGDLQFNDWFTSDSIVENFCTLVSHVTISMPTTVSISSTDVATEVDLTSSSFSTSGDDGSDQEMDMADTVADTSLLALEATQSQALVPITRATATVTSYGVHRSPPASHSHLRALPPALSPAAQAGVIAVGVASPAGASQMSGQGSRGPGSSIEIARYYAQVSNESVASESGGPAIQYAASSTSNDNQIFIQESVISLLLKLHSKLSNAADSYALPAEERTEGAAAASASNQGERESRIGDGPFWVAKVLNKLCALDPGMRETIAATKQALWPPRPSETGESETLDEAKEREKKRKIKERQTRLLQEFANKQRQFMQQAMAEEMDTDQSGEGTAFASAEQQPPEEEVETYDCVICNQSSRSTPERPVCLVVLQQATSVLAHRRFGSDNLSLPMNDTDRFSLNKSDTYAVDTSRRIGTLQRHFDESSWLLSFNMGYEGGIYVHTCGHCLHLDCYKQYVLSLRTQRRQQSLNVDRGEYACPLCRQLANSALPIATQLISGKASQDALVPRQKGKPAEELHAIFEAESSLPTGSQLMEAVGRVMEDMTNGTFQRFRQITSQPSPASIFLFVQSIARTNLEIELIQRGGSLTNTPSIGGAVAAERSPTPGASSASWNSPGYELRFSSSPTPSTSSATSSNVPWSLLPKRSCFLPLLHVLSIHAKILKTRPYSILWSQITGLHCREGAHSASQAPLSLCENETPVLIKDVTSILLQMILVLPLPLERQYFRCLVQNIYNVAAVQALAQITCQLNQKSRLLYQRLTTGPWSISSVLGFVVRFLGESPLHMEDETLSNADCTAGDLRQLNLEGDVLQPFYRILLPFLRLAALVQHHLYKEDLPSANVSNSECEEFTNLCGYLSICSETSFEDNVDPRSLISIWCEEFRVFLIRAPMAARSLLLQYRPWKNPRLLSLPHSYEALFQYYHNKTCARCNNVPKEPSLCLVCGTLVCLRENCCRQPQSMHDSVHEAVQHSVECGAGTAVYLAVNSSTIVVIRGKRACLWGSVYLDAFGEEDRELKRGKPLYLSKERYALLESQWLSHRFDHTNKKWVWHRDGL